jgi:PAS domain S-box-containing protein
MSGFEPHASLARPAQSGEGAHTAGRDGGLGGDGDPSGGWSQPLTIVFGLGAAPADAAFSAEASGAGSASAPAWMGPAAPASRSGGAGTEAPPAAGVPAAPAKARHTVGVRGVLLLLVILITAPFLLLAAVSAQRGQQAEYSVAAERGMIRARLLTARVDDLVGAVDGMLLALTETLSRDPADTARNNAQLASINARLPPVYDQLRLSLPDGTAIGHSASASPSIAQRKYFIDALTSPGLTVGEPARSYRTGEWTLGFARGVRDPSGKVVAVVSATLRLDRMQQLLDARSLPAGSRILLLNEKGRMLARTDDDERMLGSDVSRLPTGKRALELKEGTDILTTRKGVPRLTSVATAQKVPWIVVVAVPTEVALARAREQERQSLLLFAGAFAFALAAGVLVARRLIEPMRRITGDALAFAGGDLERRCDVRSPSEMGVLARTFNSLAGQVQARTVSLKESEARYRAMFEAHPQPMWVFDRPTLRFLAVNDAAVAQYGYSREEFLALKVSDVRPPEEEQRFLDYLEAQGPTMRTFGLWRHRRKDGTLLDVEVATHDITFGGRPALHSVVIDVTERMRMEREVRRLNHELEERVRSRTVELQAINRELEAFTYSVSHDLHNPLRAIDGFSMLLEQHAGASLDEEGRDYLSRIRSATQRMGNLSSALLDLSRVSRGSLRKTRVDLSALARQAAGELAALDPRRRVEWRIEPGLVAEGDAGLLRSVLDNLLGNAWKYTGRRELAVIELGGGGIEEGATGPMRCFHVRDNGSGFDMAYAAKLFLVFQRLHSPHEFEGTGVGLATVERIVQRHGGTVRGEGVPDEGACFYFSLPVPQGEAGTSQAGSGAV